MMFGLAGSQPPSFGAFKHLSTGVLNVAYVDAGLEEWSVVSLLNGWPYDINAFVDVMPI